MKVEIENNSSCKVIMMVDLLRSTNTIVNSLRWDQMLEIEGIPGQYSGCIVQQWATRLHKAGGDILRISYGHSLIRGSYTVTDQDLNEGFKKFIENGYVPTQGDNFEWN